MNDFGPDGLFQKFTKSAKVNLFFLSDNNFTIYRELKKQFLSANRYKGPFG